MKDTNKLNKEIESKKKTLIKKVKEKGLYENFGQKECRELWEKYEGSYPEIRTLILSFEDWCMNYES